MKYLKEFIVVFIYFILQITFFSQINFWGAGVNLGLVLIGLQAINVNFDIKPKYTGLILGMLLDLYLSKNFGVYTLSFFLTGIIASRAKNYLNSDSFISLSIIILIITMFYNLAHGILLKIIGYKFSMVYIFNRIFSTEIIANILVGVLFYFINVKLINAFKARDDFNV